MYMIYVIYMVYHLLHGYLYRIDWLNTEKWYKKKKKREKKDKKKRESRCMHTLMTHSYRVSSFYKK